MYFPIAQPAPIATYPQDVTFSLPRQWVNPQPPRSLPDWNAIRSFPPPTFTDKEPSSEPESDDND